MSDKISILDIKVEDEAGRIYEVARVIKIVNSIIGLKIIQNNLL